MPIASVGLSAPLLQETYPRFQGSRKTLPLVLLFLALVYVEKWCRQDILPNYIGISLTASTPKSSVRQSSLLPVAQISLRHRVTKAQIPAKAARVQALAEPGGLAEVVVEQVEPLQGATIKPIAAPPSEIAEGEVLVHIVKFVFTGNTISYSTMGKMPVFNTWGHFPYEDPRYARSPAWGIGVITNSRCADVAVGQRIFGYFPMSPWVKLQPTLVNAQNFTDGASHREKLLAPYRTYMLRPEKKNADEEDLGLADALLFGTGWGVAQQTRLDQSKTGAKTLLLISASSRTALTAAFSAKYGKLGLKVIGLTSMANEAFVKSTNMYDTVCTYDSIKTLPQEPTAVYDMAGSAKVNDELRAHYGSNIVTFGLVGGTHAGQGGDATFLSRTLSSLSFPLSLLSPLSCLVPKDLAALLIPFVSSVKHGGAQPSLFLVFQALEQASKEYGAVESQKMLDEAKEAYVKWKMPSFKASRCFGAEATLQVWQKSVSSEADPGTTYICSLWPTEDSAEPAISRLCVSQ